MIHVGLDLSLTGSGLVIIDDEQEGDARVLLAETIGRALVKPNEHQKLARIARITGVVMHRVQQAVDWAKVATVTIESAAFGANGKLFDLGGLYYVISIQIVTQHPHVRFAIAGAGTVRSDMLPSRQGSQPVKSWVEQGMAHVFGMSHDDDNKNDARLLAEWRAKFGDTFVSCGRAKSVDSRRRAERTARVSERKALAADKKAQREAERERTKRERAEKRARDLEIKAEARRLIVAAKAKARAQAKAQSGPRQ